VVQRVSIASGRPGVGKSVLEDPLVDHAIRSSQLVVRAYPRSPATYALPRIAARLLRQLASGSGSAPAAEGVFL